MTCQTYCIRINLVSFSFQKLGCLFHLKARNCAPTQTKYNEKHLNQEIDHFYRRIKLPPHFGPNDSNKNQAEEDIFKPSNKNWLPKSTHHTIETFIDLA